MQKNAYRNAYFQIECNQLPPEGKNSLGGGGTKIGANRLRPLARMHLESSRVTLQIMCKRNLLFFKILHHPVHGRLTVFVLRYSQGIRSRVERFTPEQMMNQRWCRIYFSTNLSELFTKRTVFEIRCLHDKVHSHFFFFSLIFFHVWFHLFGQSLILSECRLFVIWKFSNNTVRYRLLIFHTRALFLPWGFIFSTGTFIIFSTVTFIVMLSFVKTNTTDSNKTQTLRRNKYALSERGRGQVIISAVQ